MKKTDQPGLALPLAPALPQADDDALMPGEFAGMYQAGFEAGYKSGRESGYQQGFNDGFSKREFASQPAASQGASEKTPSDDARERVGVTPFPVEGQPATKNGPLGPDTRNRVPGPPSRMLLGMPCKHCRVYLMSGETHCPCCKEKVASF
jgi:hypothetical protein